MSQVEQVDRDFAVDQVRNMAYQFADLYFEFVKELRNEFGEEKALQVVTNVLFKRAKERADKMIQVALQEGIEREPENIGRVSNVPYLGWVPSLGKDHCPYGAAWNKRIIDNPWFQKFACLYCDVTDTTIAEVFTGRYSHKIYENVLLGNENCERTYFLSELVKQGKYTYKQ